MNLDRAGRTELHYAATDGDENKINKLIQAGHDVNLQDKAGWTPLHFAAQSGSAVAVAALINAKARIEVLDEHGNTPLWRATFCSRGNGEIINLLREKGADPYKKNNHGVSPVQLARTIGNYDIKQYFQDLPE